MSRSCAYPASFGARHSHVTSPIRYACWRTGFTCIFPTGWKKSERGRLAGKVRDSEVSDCSSCGDDMDVFGYRKDSNCMQ